jgi:ornithine cyclodeaminase/alanine dehydrogenase-like protein (mu-crystallin family)
MVNRNLRRVPLERSIRAVALGSLATVGRVLILREADVRASIDMASCIEACERAFIAYSSGEAELPGVIHLDVPDARGEVHVKAGHLHGAPFYAVKVASGFSGIEPPAIDGLVMVFDARDGSPAAFLLDGGYMTDLRTGAAGGVAARHLAPERVERVAVIGTGAQARHQVDALARMRPGLAEVRVWGRDGEHAARAARDLRARHDLVVTTVPTVREAVEGADVVLTCTAARSPLLQASWIEAGAHVTAVGSDAVGKQELDPEIPRRADVLVVDSLDQCTRLGELQHVPEQAERAVELGAVCAGRALGRSDEDQLTVCDLTGVGVQDVAAANAVLAAASGLGETIEL